MPLKHKNLDLHPYKSLQGSETLKCYLEQMQQGIDQRKQRKNCTSFP